MIALLLLLAPQAYFPPEDIRHEHLLSMQAAFSRFSGSGPGGSVERQQLPNFVRFVVTNMHSASVPADQVVKKSTELTEKLARHLPRDAEHYTLSDVLRATAAQERGACVLSSFL